MRIQKFLFQNLGVVQGVVNTKSYLFSVLNSLVLYLSLQYNKKKYMRCTVFNFFLWKHMYNGQITQWSGVWKKLSEIPVGLPVAPGIIDIFHQALLFFTRICVFIFSCCWNLIIVTFVTSIFYDFFFTHINYDDLTHTMVGNYLYESHVPWQYYKSLHTLAKQSSKVQTFLHTTVDVTLLKEQNWACFGGWF